MPNMEYDDLLNDPFYESENSEDDDLSNDSLYESENSEDDVFLTNLQRLNNQLRNINNDSLSSRDVFELRKNGELDKAYELAKKLISKNTSDEWNIKWRVHIFSRRRDTSS